MSNIPNPITINTKDKGGKDRDFYLHRHQRTKESFESQLSPANENINDQIPVSDYNDFREKFTDVDKMINEAKKHLTSRGYTVI